MKDTTASLVFHLQLFIIIYYHKEIKDLYFLLAIKKKTRQLKMRFHVALNKKSNVSFLSQRNQLSRPIVFCNLDLTMYGFEHRLRWHADYL